MTEQRAPLVPAEVDLRDFAFMPLDVLRLRDSGLTAKASGDEFRAAVLLWCASWHQVPASSLPDDDAELASLCGYSRAMKEWAKIRNGALRGWIVCSDGRMYHPTVAAKANESWSAKLAQRARTEAARRAREEARQRQSQSLSQRNAESVTETVTASKGQGQGQGQGIEKKDMVADCAATVPPPAPPLKAKDLIAEGVDRQAAADWLALRKAKRLPLTPTAWGDTKSEGEKAGLTPPQTVAKAVANNWAGFKAAWLRRDAVNGASAPALDFDGVH